MLKRTSVAVMIVAAIFCLAVGNASARTPDDFGNGDGRPEKIYRHDFPKPPAPQPTPSKDTGSPNDNWLIYWYVCGTDIETERIHFKRGTNLEANQIVIGDERNPGDATRCIREIERATLSPKVTVFMQAGGTFVWGHEKFRDLNAKLKVQEYEKYDLWALGALKNYEPISNGKLGRYVYNFNERDWIPRKQLDISGISDSETDMGSKAGLVSFLQEGQKLERERYPDGNVRRVFIFVDHGGGSLNGVCKDAYTGNMLSLQELKQSFAQVQGEWANADAKPFEVVVFDACLMSTYETAVALEDTANYMVASQEVMYGKVMFDYTGLLNELSANPAMSGAQLGKIICDTYKEDSQRIDDEFNWHTQDVLTMSVTDLSKIDSVTKALMNFGAAARVCADARSEKGGSILAPLSSVALKAENYSNDTIRREYYHMVDLKDFAAQVKQTRTLSEYPRLEKASNDLIRAIDNAVIYNVRGEAFKRGGGLSFVYPYEVREDAINGYENLTNNGFGVQAQRDLYKIMSEDSKKDLFNLSDLEEVPVTVNQNKNSVAIKLDKKQMERIAGVRGMFGRLLSLEKDDSIAVILYGSDTGMKEDWRSGKFESAFSGECLTLDGRHAVISLVVADSVTKDKHGNKISGSELYAVPIKLNGEECNLMITCTYPERTLRIVGARHGVFEQIRRDELLSIKPGDIITPQYVFFKINFVALAKAFKIDTFIEKYGDDPKSWTEAQIKEVQDMLTAEGLMEAGELTKRGEEIMEANFDGGIYDGAPFTVGDKITATFASLHDGDYFYMFEFVNPTGGKNTCTTANSLSAVFTVKDGKTTLKAKP